MRALKAVVSAFLLLLVWYGIVGRIDFEVARLDHSPFRAEYVVQFDLTNTPQ